MGSPITTDSATSLDTLLVHHRDRRRRLATIERSSVVDHDGTAGRNTTAEHDPSTGHDAGSIPGDDDSTLSRIIEVRNGHRTVGRARGRLLQTSLIFQALLVLATILGIVAILQYRAAAADGSPDAQPPSVLVQVSD
jgi:hypothetical protein